MKTSVFRAVLFALIGCVLWPLAVAYALPSPACHLPFAHPAAKRLAETTPPSSEDFLIRAPSPAVRAAFELTSFYQQWIDVEGFPVVASENVNPSAVKEAAWLIWQLMSHRPAVLQAMVQNRASFSVIAYSEMLTQIPEYAYLRPSFFWDRRARGLGTRESSCGEENLLNYPGDPYDGYNVLIHEFSHSVHRYGLNTVDPDFDDRLGEAFDSAIAQGLWKGTYASTNKNEYWAEGVQVWFDAQFAFFGINTRAKLKDYDPVLAELITEVFGDTDWRYTPATTRTQLPHLQGFDPQYSPTFAWPPELVACFKQLFDPASDGGDKWVNLTLYDPSQLSSLRSLSSEMGETEIVLINNTAAPITYYWLAPNGAERYRGRLAFGHHIIQTLIGHIWLVKDQYDKDLVVFRAEEKTGRAFVSPSPANALAATSNGAKPSTLKKISGDEQQGLVGAALAEPFVVAALDQNGSAKAGVVVRFSIAAGGGTLSAATATTDATGRARNSLRLGPKPGPNMVAATVANVDTVLTFTATGQASEYAGFDGKRVARPSRTELRQNAPNPFNSETVVSYFLLEPGLVRLEVFALSGQRVAVLSEGPQSAGYHRLHWDGRDAAGARVASGVYLYRLTTDQVVAKRKLILLR